MYHREAFSTLVKLAETYPVVTLTGPRQSGKTTLSKAAFPKKKYVSLEDLHIKEYAQQDPQGFLKDSEEGLIIDEAQKCPELFSYIQGIVDSSKQAGQFILTGSQQFGLLSGITQSLAGRVAMLELLPFSFQEIPQEKISSLDHALYQGFYPPLYDRNFDTALWHEDYIKTYLERDVRNLTNVKDLSTFRKFLNLCAARNGQLVNFSELSVASGVDTRTVKSWLSILEASYIIFFLTPHHNNFSKRQIKSPKLYFYDCGLLSALLLLEEKDITYSLARGMLFESMIISEFMKFKMNHRARVNFFFWKDSKSCEIDLILEKSQKLRAIEMKSGATLQPSFFNNLKKFQKYAKEKHQKSFVIYGGDERQQRTHGEALPWQEVRASIE